MKIEEQMIGNWSFRCSWSSNERSSYGHRIWSYHCDIRWTITFQWRHGHEISKWVERDFQGNLSFYSLVEWSSDEDFLDVSFDIIKNCFLREYVIRNLTVGQKCYVRVSAGNLKGFGESIPANPPYCIPSSRDFWKRSSRIGNENSF